jgi:hypothetical protein
LVKSNATLLAGPYPSSSARARATCRIPPAAVSGAALCFGFDSSESSSDHVSTRPMG